MNITRRGQRRNIRRSATSGIQPGPAYQSGVSDTHFNRHDRQCRTPQWTVGKNFDNTGPFGPVFVSADELPPGAHGLKIETRLNGRVMQSATTADLIFDVATLVALISEAMTLEPGDLIITGTPAGVGAARKPPVFMKAGDICEVEIEGIGILRNPIVDEAAATADAA